MGGVTAAAGIAPNQAMWCPPLVGVHLSPEPDVRPEDEDDDDIFDNGKPIPWWRMLEASAFLVVGLLALAVLGLHFLSN